MLVHSLERDSRKSVLEEKIREMCNGRWLKHDVMLFDCKVYGTDRVNYQDLIQEQIFRFIRGKKLNVIFFSS